MKELMHNKKFKKRLIKWTLMYCGVMCFLTLVVTYSRFVSSQASSSLARAASFDIDIKQDISCDDMKKITPKNVACFDKSLSDSSEGLRAKPQIGFYFTVDTSKLEVNSTIALTTTIKKQEQDYFKGYKLYDITELVKTEEMLKDDQISLPLQKTDEEKETILQYVKNQEISQKGINTYLLILDYDYDKYKFDSLNLDKGVVTIGYSAVQVD